MVQYQYCTNIMKIFCILFLTCSPYHIRNLHIPFSNIEIVQCYREFATYSNSICALHIFHLLYHSTNLHMQKYKCCNYAWVLALQGFFYSICAFYFFDFIYLITLGIYICKNKNPRKPHGDWLSKVFKVNLLALGFMPMIIS